MSAPVVRLERMMGHMTIDDRSVSPGPSSSPSPSSSTSSPSTPDCSLSTFEVSASRASMISLPSANAPSKMPQEMLPAGFKIRTYDCPLPESLLDGLYDFLGHKGMPWLQDIRSRLGQQEGGNIFNVIRNEALSTEGEHGSKGLACQIWVGFDYKNPDVGIFGHVFTAEHSRKKGLAAVATRQAQEEFKKRGGKALHLGVTNPVAARLYSSMGFVHLCGGLDTPLGEWIMIWLADKGTTASTAASPSDVDAFFLDYYFKGDKTSENVATVANSLKWEKYERRHTASAMLLFFADRNEESSKYEKLPLLGVHNGLEAEHAMVNAAAEQDNGNMKVLMLVDPSTQHVYGVAVQLKDQSKDAYTLPGFDCCKYNLSSKVWDREFPSSPRDLLG